MIGVGPHSSYLGNKFLYHNNILQNCILKYFRFGYYMCDYLRGQFFFIIV